MEWDWSSVPTATGRAADIVPFLDDLLGGDEERRDHAFHRLFTEIVNQGDLSPAAAPATDRIMRTLRKRGTLPEYGWLMLFELFRGASYGRTVCAPDGEHDIEVYCRRRILAGLEVIERSVAGLAGKAFSSCMLLLGSMGAYIPEIRAILAAEVSRSSGERLQAASDALEVAVELAAEREQVFEEVRAACAGRPIDDVRRALAAGFEKAELYVWNEVAEDAARTISEGR
ncbi:hypothetical protein [Nonomuraea candida]|uniref:hypothetical protein n=1 Tax=Nonomuraea candida TaxID=359159 RepID=UPI0005BAB67D|nr:hypothetical protein [Nonomuraea candida]